MTITIFDAGGGGGNAFGTVAVSGQSDVVADATNDTLTLAAGTNVTLTTNAGTDTVTISASAGSLDIGSLTAITDVDATADYAVVLDATDSLNKKVLVTDVLKSLQDLTEDTAPNQNADFGVTYDASATSAKKIRLQMFGNAGALATGTAAITLGVSHRGKFVELTGSTNRTWDTDAAATLGPGWATTVVNSSTAEITLDPNGAETIDGLTSFKVYPGEVRHIVCNGTNFFSYVLHPFYITIAQASSPFTFTKPPGYKMFGVRCGGAGGAGGKSRANGTGGGGGGGACVEGQFAASLVGTTETITIGAGATAVSAADTAGAAGGNTTFGSLLTAYGGGGGFANAAGGANGSGGGGGGAFSAGSTGTSAVGGNGGLPMAGTGGSSAGTDTLKNMASAFGGGGGGSDNDTPLTGEGGQSTWGGGGGGGRSTTGTGATAVGGQSTYGGGGGGSAGTTTAGGAGGTSVFGGAGGAGNFDASNATAGTAGANGYGGGGGGGSETGNSGAGGNGSAAVWGIV